MLILTRNSVKRVQVFRGAFHGWLTPTSRTRDTLSKLRMARRHSKCHRSSTADFRKEVSKAKAAS